MWGLLPAGLVASFSGWPPGLPPGSHTNIVLAFGLSVLVVWWGMVVRATRGHPVGVTSRMGLAAALVGWGSAATLSLGAFVQLGPPALILVVALGVMELPAWGLVLLSWPGQELRAKVSPIRAFLDLGILGTSSSLLLWDFLYRPVGRFPPFILEQLGWASWIWVVLIVHWKAWTGSRSDSKRASGLLMLSLGVAFAGSFTTATFPMWSPRVLSAAATLAILLRLIAADQLLAGSGSQAARTDGDQEWNIRGIGLGALVLLGLHQALASPTESRALPMGIAALGLLLFLREVSIRRS